MKNFLKIVTLLFLLFTRLTEANVLTNAQATYPKRAMIYVSGFFKVEYPMDFTVYPPNRRANMSDEATFVSPDEDVEFYIYSPQWSGRSSYLNRRANEIIESDSNKKIHNKKELKYISINWRTYKDKHGRYKRAYMHKRVCPYADQASGCTTLVFGIKFKNQASYDRYKKEYLRFKKSLEQYAD